jgi:5-methylcytosine-specific restriction endonuclease McrA
VTLSRQHRAKNRRRWDAARQKVEAEGECRACLATGELEAAHVIPRSLGGGQSEDSVVPLCPQCHRDQHDHKLALAPLLTDAEWREAGRVLGFPRAYRYLTNSHPFTTKEETR